MAKPKKEPAEIPRFSPGSVPLKPPRYPSELRPKPEKTKIEIPPHACIRPHEVGFPLKKILDKESQLSYGLLHPASRNVRLFFFLFVLAAYASIALLCSYAAASFLPIWAGLLSALLLILPYFASESIEIIFLLETYRFSLQPEFLYVRSGSIDPIYEMVPYENIQDAQVSQGLVARLFNVSTVIISTPASSLFISYLDNQTAKKFRENLLSLAKAHRGLAE